MSSRRTLVYGGKICVIEENNENDECREDRQHQRWWTKLKWKKFIFVLGISTLIFGALFLLEKPPIERLIEIGVWMVETYIKFDIRKF